jgi:hypothetical protein
MKESFSGSPKVDYKKRASLKKLAGTVAVAAVSLAVGEYKDASAQEQPKTIETAQENIELVNLSGLKTQEEVDAFVRNYNSYLQDRITRNAEYLAPQTAYYSLAFDVEDYNNFQARSGLPVSLVEFVRLQTIKLNEMIQESNQNLPKYNFPLGSGINKIECRRVILVNKGLHAEHFVDDDGTHQIASGYYAKNSSEYSAENGDPALAHEAWHCHVPDFYAMNTDWRDYFLNYLKSNGITPPPVPEALNGIPDAWRRYWSVFAALGPDLMDAKVNRFTDWMSVHLAMKVKEGRLHNKQILNATNWNYPSRVGIDIPEFVQFNLGVDYAGQELEIYRTNNPRLREVGDLKDFVLVHQGALDIDGKFLVKDVFRWPPQDTNSYGVPSGETVLLIKLGNGKFQYLDIRFINLAAWMGYQDSAEISLNLFDNQTPPPEQIKPDDYGIQISQGPERGYKASLPFIQN